MKDFPEAENAAYDVLRRVLTGGAYSSVELDRTLEHVPESLRARITALVYGVLDKSVSLDFVISGLTRRTPKPNLAVLLKLGLYEAIFSTTPIYAAANKYTELAKVRMKGTEGFVNAVMRRAHSVRLPEPADANDAETLSVATSRPLWLIKRFISDFGIERTRLLLCAKLPEMTHLRPNGRFKDNSAFDRAADECGVIRTDRGIYASRRTLKMLDPSSYTAQSLSSIYAAEAYVSGLSGKLEILDMCAAPGGKSVYVSELLPDSHVTACDIHPHRVNLIKSYSSRMHADNITAYHWDATRIREEWRGRFDLVICDVPCTGSGLVCSSPDIVLGKTDDDIYSLNEVQAQIIENASKYVADGGRLAYSTCSLLKEENEKITDAFVCAHPEFKPLTDEFGKGDESDGKIEFFPDKHGCDGFYIARFTRR